MKIYGACQGQLHDSLTHLESFSQAEPALLPGQVTVERIVDGPFVPPIPRESQTVKLNENYELDVRLLRWYEPGT
jgi:hypothetical protein